MAEELFIDQSLGKEEKYQTLIPQIKALLDGEPNRIANMANVSAVLKEAFQLFWVGFYLVDKTDMVLGPFQGPIACTRIPHGKGVCGTVWAEGVTIIVDDVDQFPGHIACSSASRSEIVVPVKVDGEVVAVLDIDSDQLSQFDHVDQRFLEEICALIR